MNQPDDAEVERLLADLMAGDRDASDPSVRKLLEQRPELRPRVEALRQIAGDLLRIGHDHSAAVAAAQAATTAMDVAAARATITAARQRHRRFWWGVSLAGAAAAVGIAYACWPQPDPPPPIDVPLGTDERNLRLAPQGRADVTRFSWQRAGGAVVLPPGGTLKVVVYPVRDGKRVPIPILNRGELTGEGWEPTPTELERLRAETEIWWELRAVSPRGGEQVLGGVHVEPIGSLAPAPPTSPAAAQLCELCRKLALGDDVGAAIVEHVRSMTAATPAASGTATPGDLLAAVAAGREAGHAQPRPGRIQYERVVGLLLELGGAREAALEQLRRQFGAMIEVDAADPRRREIVHEHFLGMFDLAQRLHATGDFDAALQTATRAQAIANDVSKHDSADAKFLEARIWIDLGALDEAWRRIDDGHTKLASIKSGVADDSLALACITTAEYWLAQDAHAPAAKALAEYGDERPPRSDLACMRALVRLCTAESEGRGDPPAEASLRAQLPQLVAARRSGAARRMLVRAALLRGDHEAAARELEWLRADAEADATHSWRGSTETATLTTRWLRLSGAPMDELARHAPVHRAAFAALVAEWRGKCVQPSGVGFLALTHRRQVLTELVRLETALAPGRGAEVAAEALLTIGACTSLARRLGTGAVSLADVRATFAGRDACILAFLAEPNGSLAVAIDAETVRCMPLAGSISLDSTRRELRAALSVQAAAAELTDHEARLWTYARDLGDKILTPELRAYLATKRTITVADHGLLGGVPIECLAWDDRTLFGEQFAVNTMTSLPAGVVLARQHYRPHARTAASIQLIATLQQHPELADGTARKFAVAELEPLLARYARRTELVDAHATIAGVDSLAADATVTQFVCHGVAGANSGPKIVLAPGGPVGLYGAEHALANRAGGLVILTACGLGLVPLRLGDDPLFGTLGAAALERGAHTAVQSTADLHLRAQLALLERFHTHLLGGAPTAEAMRRARAQCTWAGDRFEAAQVQVHGLGTHPVVTN